MIHTGKSFAKIIILAMVLAAVAPSGTYAADDLHDLYNALQSRARSVTVPAKVLARLGLPAADVSGKEIVVTEANRNQHGITLFTVAGTPYITMFRIETDKMDAWWLRFGLDGRVLNEKWGQEGLGTFDIASVPIAEGETAFWRHWIAGGTKPPL